MMKDDILNSAPKTYHDEFIYFFICIFDDVQWLDLNLTREMSIPSLLQTDCVDVQQLPY